MSVLNAATALEEIHRILSVDGPGGRDPLGIVLVATGLRETAKRLEAVLR